MRQLKAQSENVGQGGGELGAATRASSVHIFWLGAGAADFHFGGALGVEEERGAPAVAEVAGGIDCGRIRRKEHEAELVTAGEGGGDLGVGADGVAVPREVAAEGGDDLEHEAQVGADVARGGVEGVGERGAGCEGDGGI